MKNALIVRNLFVILALLQSHIMCIVVAFCYGRWNETFNSAPVTVNLLYAIPFMIGICACLLVAWNIHNRAQDK